MKKYYIILGLLLISYGLGRYSAPEKIKVVTKMQVKTVIEEKIRIKTVIKELPSGEKTTTIVYQNDTHMDKSVAKSSVKVVKNKKPQFSVSLSNNYLAVDRRILGNLFVGGYVTNVNVYGVYLRYTF